MRTIPGIPASIKFSFFSVSLLFFIQCANKPVDPQPQLNFVDTYIPQLTEAQGTSYPGDYFPLKALNKWSHTGNNGTYTLQGTVKIPIDSVNTLDTTLTMTDTIGEITNSSVVLAEKNVLIGTKTYPVFPLCSIDTSTFSSSLNDTSFTYIQKTDTALWVRGIGTSGDPVITEVPEQKILKIPLVVGDSWKTAPAVNIAQIISGLDTSITNELGTPTSTVTMKTGFFVIGRENKIWKGTTITTVRVDQVTEAQIDVKFMKNGVSNATITVAFKMKNILNYLKDTGLVFENFDVSGTVAGSGILETKPFNFSITLTTKGDLALSTFTLNRKQVMRSAPFVTLPKNRAVDVSTTVIKKVISTIKAAHCL